MPEEIIKKSSRFRRNLKGIFKSAYNIVLPPVAGKHHQRYNNRRWLLFVDTLLTLLLFFLAGTVVYFLTSKQLIPPPVVNAEMSVPEVINNGTKTQIDLRLSNNESLNLSNIEVKLHYPNEFVFESANVQPNGDSNTVWDIAELVGGKTEDIQIVGHVIGKPDTQSEFRALIQYNSGNQRLSQTLTKPFNIIGEILSLTTSAPEKADSGQTYTQNVIVKNKTDYELTQAVIEIKIPDTFVITKVTEPFEKGTTEWTVNSIKPRAEWSVKLSGYIIADVDQLSSFETSVRVMNQGVLYGQASKKNSVTIEAASNIPEIINKPEAEKKDLQFAAEAHYYSTTGIQFGYGPLPPRVGEETGYRIFWLLDNPGLDISGLTISTFLPENVTWAGNQSVSSGQPITYDVNTRKVEWPINNINESDKYLTGSFDVIIKPLAGDLGKIIKLTEESDVFQSLSGTKKIISRYPKITTLLSDKQAIDKAKVTR